MDRRREIDPSGSKIINYTSVKQEITDAYDAIDDFYKSCDGRNQTDIKRSIDNLIDKLVKLRGAAADIKKYIEQLEIENNKIKEYCKKGEQLRKNANSKN